MSAGPFQKWTGKFFRSVADQAGAKKWAGSQAKQTGPLTPLLRITSALYDWNFARFFMQKIQKVKVRIIFIAKLFCVAKK